jgi:hypothetical protein
MRSLFIIACLSSLLAIVGCGSEGHESDSGSSGPSFANEPSCNVTVIGDSVEPESDAGSVPESDVDTGTPELDSGDTPPPNEDSGTPPPPREDAGTCSYNACTYTQGFYKNHPEAWANVFLTMGGVAYSQSESMALLNLPSLGDGSVILAKQLIAALLNGGECNPNVTVAVAAAQDWMSANKDADGRLPYGTMCDANNQGSGCPAVALGETLDQFNNGLSGTPHCGDEVVIQ